MIKTLYRSLYWRIGFGFILCLAGVLTFQAAVVFALLNRTEAVGESLTQAASAALGQAIATEPRRDLQRFFEEHYPSPPRSMFAVLSTGQVLTAGRKLASDRVVEVALREFQRKPVRSLPRGWQGDPYHASAIVVGAEIVGAVAVVPETWVERLGPALLASSFGLLLVGTALSSIFIFGPAHRRLKELESVALRLGAGDMNVRARDDGGDEVARVARAFNRMAADLAASDRARRLLLADVSHELMTPLTAVRGYHERLAADPLIASSPSLSSCSSAKARMVSNMPKRSSPLGCSSRRNKLRLASPERPSRMPSPPVAPRRRSRRATRSTSRRRCRESPRRSSTRCSARR